jgi:hypothetical protein
MGFKVEYADKKVAILVLYVGKEKTLPETRFASSNAFLGPRNAFVARRGRRGVWKALDPLEALEALEALDCLRFDWI